MIHGGRPASRAEESKRFFFVKKKQKTLACLLPARSRTAASSKKQKFFGSFFQKRTSFLRLGAAVLGLAGCADDSGFNRPHAWTATASNAANLAASAEAAADLARGRPSDMADGAAAVAAIERLRADRLKPLAGGAAAGPAPAGPSPGGDGPGGGTPGGGAPGGPGAASASPTQN
jgi:hypothetical protein